MSDRTGQDVLRRASKPPSQLACATTIWSTTSHSSCVSSLPLPRPGVRSCSAPLPDQLHSKRLNGPGYTTPAPNAYYCSSSTRCAKPAGDHHKKKRRQTKHKNEKEKTDAEHSRPPHHHSKRSTLHGTKQKQKKREKKGMQATHLPNLPQGRRNNKERNDEARQRYEY